jgi:hypothetical protein
VRSTDKGCSIWTGAPFGFSPRAALGLAGLRNLLKAQTVDHLGTTLLKLPDPKRRVRFSTSLARKQPDRFRP